MSFEKIEPRVEALEKIHNQNQVALSEIKNDFHHMTKAVDKIQEALTKFADIFSRVEQFESSVRRAHERLDRIEITVRNVSGDFYECKATKLNRADLKDLADKIGSIELNAAKMAWVNRLAWLILTPFVNAVILGVLGFFILGGAQ